MRWLFSHKQQNWKKKISENYSVKIQLTWLWPGGGTAGPAWEFQRKVCKSLASSPSRFPSLRLCSTNWKISFIFFFVVLSSSLHIPSVRNHQKQTCQVNKNDETKCRFETLPSYVNVESLEPIHEESSPTCWPLHTW